MKRLIIVILFTSLYDCSADVVGSRNIKLPLSSGATIPSPVQSLLPPTFKNPIKHYTPGLLQPLADSQAPKAHIKVRRRQHYGSVQAPVPVHRHPTRLPVGFRTSPEPLKSIVPYRNRYALHHKVHHSTNLVQPQVYQPKTIVYENPNTHHHHHNYQQFPQRTNGYGVGFGISPAIQSRNHYPVPVPLYYASLSQSGNHRYSVPAYSATFRAPAIVQHVDPSDRHSTITARTVPSSGASIIQIYPSMSYEITLQQHGLTLNPDGSRLDPNLAHIIHEVLKQYS